ncbi:MAG: hypothetical protein IPM80_23760 [Proteobacteria bacterium]|nr:hypothetical protein [Pseudomonadota bacterium]
MSDLSSARESAPLRHGVLTALARNIIAGARVARGHTPDADAFDASLGQALLMMLLAWCATLAVEWLAAGDGATFWIWGAMAEATRMYLWLAALAVAAWLCIGRGGMSYLVVVTCSAGLPVWALGRAIEYLAKAFALDVDTPYTLVFYGSLLLWYCTLLWRALALPPLHSPRWRRALAVLCYGALLAAMHQWLPDSPIFYRAESDEPGVDVESVYYQQQHMLDAALVEMRPQTPFTTDLYFVGMAAYAEQDVFMREVLAVRDIVVRRLGLAGRTLTLINHRRTVDSYPLANRHNLARVAAGLGRIMDVDDDVAVLFLTSHGYEDSSLAVEFGPLGLNDLYAEDIRASFDQAGIRYRVIIISACYSGGFIEGLKSPDSIVITASARDRSSFGCGAERDWTYFGQAYFADALMHTTNFVTAFEQAAAAIAAREKRELKEPSRPQMWVGDNIARHLQDWQPSVAPPPQPSESR